MVFLIFLVLHSYECTQIAGKRSKQVGTWFFRTIFKRGYPVLHGGVAKLMGRGRTLEEAWPDHTIRSSIAINKLCLGCGILKKKKRTTKRRNVIF